MEQRCFFFQINLFSCQSSKESRDSFALKLEFQFNQIYNVDKTSEGAKAGNKTLMIKID